MWSCDQLAGGWTTVTQWPVEGCYIALKSHLCIGHWVGWFQQIATVRKCISIKNLNYCKIFEDCLFYKALYLIRISFYPQQMGLYLKTSSYHFQYY